MTELTPEELEEYDLLQSTFQADRSLVNATALVDFLNLHKDPASPLLEVVTTTTYSIAQIEHGG